MTEFVPAAFSPPTSLHHEAFRLTPLRPEHNVSDHAAWSSSIDPIRSTPGFEGLSWPHPMTLEENLGDLTRRCRSSSRSPERSRRPAARHKVRLTASRTCPRRVRVLHSLHARPARLKTWAGSFSPTLRGWSRGLPQPNVAAFGDQFSGAFDRWVVQLVDSLRSASSSRA